MPISRIIAGFMALMFTGLGLALPIYPFVPPEPPEAAQDPSWWSIAGFSALGLMALGVGVLLWIWAWKAQTRNSGK